MSNLSFSGKRKRKKKKNYDVIVFPLIDDHNIISYHFCNESTNCRESM